jgi:branched-chain amino acid transport system ATP-binding protein
MSVPALSVQGLTRSFGALTVAESIDIDLDAGARVGLIGPNGAGKTTLINLLTGFLKPDAGIIKVEGEAIQGMSPEKRVRRGLVRTHQINTLLTEFNVRDNVAVAIAEREGYAWRTFRFSRQWRACCAEAQERIDDMGIGEVGDRLVRELPYGQQRLLEIAIALSLKPRVLLLDEPAAGVPAAEAHVIHHALDRLPKEMAILIIEHDMDLVFRFAREIIVMVRGRVLVRATPPEIASNSEVRELYLGRTGI